MRLALISLLMVPWTVGCGGDSDKSGDDTSSETDAEAASARPTEL